jgi:hypothetical protein
MNFLFVFCKDIPNLGATSDVRYVLLPFSFIIYSTLFVFRSQQKKNQNEAARLSLLDVTTFNISLDW